MFNASYVILGEVLLWDIINELTVYEHIYVVIDDLLALVFDTSTLGCFNFFHLLVRVDLNSRAFNLDFIIVHSGVSYHNDWILNTFWLTWANFKIHNETVVQI